MLPLIGTSNRKTAISTSSTALANEKSTYGSCFPSRNSERRTGVTYRLMIDPSSFSRTTDSAARTAGIIISSRGITAGTIAGRLKTSGLYR